MLSHHLSSTRNERRRIEDCAEENHLKRTRSRIYEERAFEPLGNTDPVCVGSKMRSEFAPFDVDANDPYGCCLGRMITSAKCNHSQIRGRSHIRQGRSEQLHVGVVVRRLRRVQRRRWRQRRTQHVPGEFALMQFRQFTAHSLQFHVTRR